MRARMSARISLRVTHFRTLSRTRLCVHTYTRVHTHTHTRMYAYTHLQMSLVCGLEPSTDTIYRYMYVELM